MSFVPDDPSQPSKFVPDSPEQPTKFVPDTPVEAQATPQPGLVSQLVSKATNAAIAPITALSKPIAEAAAGFVGPDAPLTDEQANARGQQGPTQNAYDYEHSENYPHTGMTSLAPTLDVMFAAQGAKDLAGLAVKGVKNVLKNQAEKKALKTFVSSPSVAEGIPTSPIETTAVPKSAVGPDIGSVMSPPKIEAYIKGVQKGLPAKGIPDIPIYGVKGSPEDLLKEFGDAAPGSVTPEQLKKAGVALPGESTTPVVTKPSIPKQLEFPTQQPKSKGIVFNTKQTREIEKVLGKPIESKSKTLDNALGIPTTPIVEQTPQQQLINRAALGDMREPIVQPSAPKPVSRLLPGGENRVKAFQDLTTTEISPRNPLTSRAELNKKLGSAEDVATKQWLEGVKAENTAIENSLQDKKSLYQVTNVRPDTVESQALFKYIESPNKMEAYGRIAQAAGKEKADEIVKAADNMRTTYDKLFNQVNVVRKTNGLKPITYREDYITHANEMNVLSELGKLDIIGTPEGDTLAKSILNADTKLASSVPNLYTKLKDVIFPYTLRKGGETSLDAVSNFSRYIDTAHRYIQTQPYVNELFDTAKAIKAKAPNVANYLETQANFIAGGKSVLDKGVESIIDKDLLRIAQQLQNNAKGNVISMNPSVPITQLFGLVPTAGKYPLKDSLSAAVNSFANPEFEKFAIANSPVLQSRALGAAENDIMLGPIAKQSARITNWFDYKVAEVSWMAAFKNAISKGLPMEQAIQEGNTWAAISQAHLGKVSTPPMMMSKNVQALLPLMNQQIAYGRSLLLHTLQGKTVTEKTLAAIKMLIFGSAVAAIKSAVTGHADHPLSPTNILPFGGVLEQGAGGPLLNQAGRLATAKSQDGFIRQLIRTGFLLQNKIPGGAIVGKHVENFLMGKAKKK